MADFIDSRKTVTAQELMDIAAQNGVALANVAVTATTDEEDDGGPMFGQREPALTIWVLKDHEDPEDML
jgi:hypothetical protein